MANLRLDADEWTQIKAEAAELNMSAHEYLLFLIRNFSMRRELQSEGKQTAKTAPIWNLAKLSKGAGKPVNLNSDDDEIYGD